MMTSRSTTIRGVFGGVLLMLGCWVCIHEGGGTRVVAQEAGAPALASSPANGQDIAEVQEAIQRFRQGDLAGALDKFQEATAAHPELPPAKLMLARLLMAANEVATGRALLEDVAAENRDFPLTFVLFGNIALSEGRISDAELNYMQALQRVEAAETLGDDQKTELRAEAISGLAGVAERRGDWRTAQSVLEELLTFRPDDGVARQRLARALFQLDQRDEAVAQLRQAIRSDPTLDPPGITLGWLLADRGDWDEALASMREAVEADPESPAARLGLATLLIQRERPAEALPHIEKALEQAPDSLPARRLMGAAAYRLRDLDTAEAQLRSVLEESANDVATNNLLALVLADKPDDASHQEAVERAEANVQRSGQSPQSLATLGWTYYRAGRSAEAFEALQAASPGGQASPDMAYYMASILADQGQEADAMRLLRSALDAPIGQFASRAEARARLEELARTAGQTPGTDTEADTPKGADPPTSPRP